MKQAATVTNRVKDPYRFPKIQGVYEAEAVKAFKPVELFGNIVEVMTEIIKAEEA